MIRCFFKLFIPCKMSYSFYLQANCLHVRNTNECMVYHMYISCLCASSRCVKKISNDSEFYVLLTVHLMTILVNNQPDAQNFFLYLFIPIPYMFRATKRSSSGESIVSIRPLVYVTLCR